MSIHLVRTFGFANIGSPMDMLILLRRTHEARARVPACSSWVTCTNPEQVEPGIVMMHVPCLPSAFILGYLGINYAPEALSYCFRKLRCGT